MSYVNGGCTWLSVGGDRFQQRATPENRRYGDTGAHIQGGLGHQLGWSGVSASIAGSYETVHTQVDGASGQGERYQLGLSFGYRHGPLDAAVYGTFGHANVAVSRFVQTPGTSSLATGRQKFNFGQVGGELGYAIVSGSFALRHSLGGGYAYWEQQRGVESGAAPLSLSLQDVGSKGFAFVQPGVSASEAFGLGRVGLTASARGGYTRRFGDAGVTATFVGAPVQVGGLTTRSFLDRDAATAGAALRADLGHGLSAQASYDGEFGARTTNHSLMGTLRLTF